MAEYVIEGSLAADLSSDDDGDDDLSSKLSSTHASDICIDEIQSTLEAPDEELEVFNSVQSGQPHAVVDVVTAPFSPISSLIDSVLAIQWPTIIPSPDKNSNNDEDEFSFETQSTTNDVQNKVAIVSAITKFSSDEHREETVDFSDCSEVQVVSLDRNVVDPMLGVNEDHQQFLSSTNFQYKTTSKKALDDIIEVYGGGSGDIEVLMADIIDTAAAHRPVERVVVGQLFSVTEGDDEEEDEAHDNMRSLGANGSTLINEQAKEVVYADEFQFGEIDHSSMSNDHVELNNGSQTVLTLQEAITYLSTLDLTKFDSSIVSIEKPESLPRWQRVFIRRPTELNFPNSSNELRLPFLIAELDFNPYLPQHLGMVTAIFQQLLPRNDFSEQPLKAIDDRWELLGFQGRDPRTDVNRSMKMLAILQMLAFLDCSRLFGIFLFRLSQSSSPLSHHHVTSRKFDSSWPFMCVSIMFTKESLQALRRGDLNVACNKAKNVFSVLHAFHHGCFVDFAKRLQLQPNVHHGILLAEVREKCSKSPNLILALFNDSEITRIMVKKSDKSIVNEATTADDLDLHDLSKIDEQQAELSDNSNVNLTAKASRFVAN